MTGSTLDDPAALSRDAQLAGHPDGPRKGGLKKACTQNTQISQPRLMGSSNCGRNLSYNQKWTNGKLAERVRNKVGATLMIGAWNVRTLLDRAETNRPERRTALVAKELSRYNIDIAALSETRLADEGQLSEAGSGYTFFWVGKPADHPRMSGVGFAIRNSLLPKLESLPKGINDRLMSIRIKLRDNRYLTLVSVYAPTLTNDDTTKELFYESLDKIITETPRNDKLIVLGDFNARVGKDSITWKGVLGPHGVGKENSNGVLLLSKCAQHQLTITGTIFRQADKFKTTWQHPRSKHWHQIDHMLVRQRDIQDVHSTRVMRGAECWTDHRLIRSKLALHIQAPKRNNKLTTVKKLDINRLKDPSVKAAFNTDMEIALGQLTPDLYESEQKWNELRDAVYKTAAKTLGYKKHRSQDWFDDNDTAITALLDEKHKAYAKVVENQHSSHKQAHNEIKRKVQLKLRKMQDHWWDRKAEELQNFADRHDSRFYEALKAVYGPSKSTVAPIRSEDGGALFTDKASIMQRWNEYFKDLLNRTSAVSAQSIAQINCEPVQEHLANPLTLKEVQAAITAMKSNRAPGPDGIPAEIWTSSNVLAEQLHIVLGSIWDKEDVPQQFKDANIVTIWKRKGSKSDCSNYRGISLLAIAGKILGRVLLNRLTRSIIEPILTESQCGFRANRGTTDMVFSARQLQEKCREQNKDLYMVFIDLTKAFDTVSRSGLWSLLAKFGCPSKLINIIKQLHEGMIGRVCSDGMESDGFAVTNGVKQGCVIAPSLFSLFFAAMLKEATQDMPQGVTIRFRPGKIFNLARLRSSTKVTEALIRELLFADDCMLVAHTEENIQQMVTKFSNASKNYGLQISITKTEVMFQPAPGKTLPEPKIAIDGAELTNVKRFTYLGSVLSHDTQIDDDIQARINKASSAFGRLEERVWKPHGIRLRTKLKVYKAAVLTTLLYGAESWTCYRRHIQILDAFHMRHLRAIMGIKWQDKVTNNEVLQRAQMDGMEAMLMNIQLRWVGHVQRMDETRIPKQIFFGELSSGVRNRGGQKKRYKDTLKQTLKLTNIDVESWHEMAEERPVWRHAVRTGVRSFEANRQEIREVKRQKRKACEALKLVTSPTTDRAAQVAEFSCPVCDKLCGSRIGLFSHSRTHQKAQH